MLCALLAGHYSTPVVLLSERIEICLKTLSRSLQQLLAQLLWMWQTDCEKGQLIWVIRHPVQKQATPWLWVPALAQKQYHKVVLVYVRSRAASISSNTHCQHLLQMLQWAATRRPSPILCLCRPLWGNGGWTGSQALCCLHPITEVLWRKICFQVCMLLCHTCWLHP